MFGRGARLAVCQQSRMLHLGGCEFHRQCWFLKLHHRHSQADIITIIKSTLFMVVKDELPCGISVYLHVCYTLGSSG